MQHSLGEKTLRRWQLAQSQSVAFPIAADSRLCETDYTDDQVWQLVQSAQGETALALYTRYGGRVNQVQLTPIWTPPASKPIVSASQYHSAPQLTYFSAGYLCLEATLVPDLQLTAEYWVAESHALLTHYTLHNASSAPLTIGFDLAADVIIRNQDFPVATLVLENDEYALHLGKLGNINPVVFLEGGQIGVDKSGSVAPKLHKSLTLAPNSRTQIRWVHAAIPTKENALRLARYWLSQDWQALKAGISVAQAHVPNIESGNDAQDFALALGYQQLIQSFLQPTDKLPHASFVLVREPANGYSAAPHGADYIREWSGQTPPAAYLISQAIASIAPEYAEGVLLNYLSQQLPDGTIDWAPGMGGQSRELLAMPILARMAWGIYQQTQNDDFLKRALPALSRFYARWFQSDTDQDGDGHPEWQSVNQTGYSGWQAFSAGTDIQSVETPDLAAYLYSEAQALLKIAQIVGDDSLAATLEPHTETLKASLQTAWNKEYFVYRDKHTHISPSPITLLDKVRADEEQILAYTLNPVSRVIIELIGGAGSPPRMSLNISGKDASGNPVQETLDSQTLQWSYGRGTLITKHTYSYIERIVPSGLSRVFRMSATTPNLASLDINGVLPIIASDAITPEQRETLLKALTQSGDNTLLQPNGLSLYPSSGGNSSGIWVFWNTLIIEALLDLAQDDTALMLFQRLLNVQVATLNNSGKFATFYHEREPRGMSERADLSGIIPYHLFLRMVGVQLWADGSVALNEKFLWGQDITLTHNHTRITRTATYSEVQFKDAEPERIPAAQAHVFRAPAPPPPPALSLPAKPSPEDAPPITEEIPPAADAPPDAPPMTDPTPTETPED